METSHAERLHRVIGRMTFGQPLLRFFQPHFEVVVRDAIEVNLVISTTDSRPPHGQVRVKYPVQLSCADFSRMNDDEVLALLRALVHHMMTHEADEALCVDGVRRWHPHDSSFVAAPPDSAAASQTDASFRQREPTS